MNKMIFKMMIIVGLMVPLCTQARVDDPGLARRKLNLFIRDYEKNPLSDTQIKQALADMSPSMREEYVDLVWPVKSKERIGNAVKNISKQITDGHIKDSETLDLRIKAFAKLEGLKDVEKFRNIFQGQLESMSEEKGKEEKEGFKGFKSPEEQSKPLIDFGSQESDLDKVLDTIFNTVKDAFDKDYYKNNNYENSRDLEKLSNILTDKSLTAGSTSTVGLINEFSKNIRAYFKDRAIHGLNMGYWLEGSKHYNFAAQAIVLFNRIAEFCIMQASKAAKENRCDRYNNIMTILKKGIEWCDKQIELYREKKEFKEVMTKGDNTADYKDIKEQYQNLVKEKSNCNK
jgi:hypothetical protein